MTTFDILHFYKFCPNLLNGGIHKYRTPANTTLRTRNSCSMVEFRVECLTYPHSRARPVPSRTSPGYDLPPTTTMPVRRPMNIKRPSRLESRAFLTGTKEAFIRCSFALRCLCRFGMQCREHVQKCI